MGSQKYLILRKDEWERIKRQHKPCGEPTIDKEYIQRMHELSQEWIKSWPDTIKGHIEFLKKLEARKRKKDIEEIKKLASQKKKDCSVEAIQKARQAIFEDSCYGKQLISCLIESKAIEEREAQLKLQKDLKEKAIIDEKEMITKEKRRNLELEDKKMNKLRQKQKNDREIAEINKTMFITQNKNNIRDKEMQKQAELEDMKIIKNHLEDERKSRLKDKTDTNKQILKDNVKYVQYKKQLEENRATEEKNHEHINKMWHEYYDRVRRKKNIVHEEIKKKDSSKKLQVFQYLEQIKKIEENLYNDFVDKGIKRMEQKLDEEDRQRENKKRNVENKKSYSIKSTEPQNKGLKSRDISNVCECDRQILLCKPKKKHCNNTAMDFKEGETLQLLEPSKSLGDELKEREKEPFPWSGTKAAHEQFTYQANQILEECSYKTMARKVIDEYIKINGLNPNDLPIANYL